MSIQGVLPDLVSQLSRKAQQRRPYSVCHGALHTISYPMIVTITVDLHGEVMFRYVWHRSSHSLGVTCCCAAATAASLQCGGSLSCFGS